MPIEYCQHSATQSDCSGEDTNKWNSTSTEATGMENNLSCGFNCNICLDLLEEPVVTFCGHLYCWPCIYRWMHCQKCSFENSSQQPECPVCKAEVSQNTLIPLYGRGQPRKPTDSRGTKLNVDVPERPNGPGCRVHTLVTTTTSGNSQNPDQQLHYRGYHPQHHQVHPYNSLVDHSHSPTFGFAGTTTYNPMIDMFGKMIYARYFGDSDSLTTLYAYPNTYSDVAISSARGRRHMRQADRSLSRISFFFCCCLILCLLLF